MKNPHSTGTYCVDRFARRLRELTLSLNTVQCGTVLYSLKKGQVSTDCKQSNHMYNTYAMT